MAGTIVAMGGGLLLDPASAFERHLLELSGRERPRVRLLATAGGDRPERIAAFYAAWARRPGEALHVPLHGIPDRPLEALAEADVVLVLGGNTANLLAVWRLHGVDEALRAAWERGAVLGGASAGANCWFEACVTDSFSAELAPLRDGLGLLPGSFCPHFGEPARQEAVARLVPAELPPGWAADDDAALVFRGPDLAEAVAQRRGARAWRVGAGGVEAIEPRLLP